jgi:hypothetical protein
MSNSAYTSQAYSIQSPGIVPNGRLSLTSNVSIMTANVINAGAVYYVPHNGNLIPIYNGTSFNYSSFSQLTMTLNSTNQVSGGIYDLYVFLNSGTVTIGASPSWTTTTAGSSARGTSQAVNQLNGIWVNTNAMTLKNGTTSYSVSAQQATYVGSIYMTAAGATTVALSASAGGGGGNVMGVFNAYNRSPARVMSIDSNGSWSTGSTSWRAADGSTNNRITWLDGLQQIGTIAYYKCLMQWSGSGTTNMGIGFSYNSVGSPVIYGDVIFPAGNVVDEAIQYALVPQFGLNYVQALEASLNSVTITFNGNTGGGQALMLDMEF